MILNELYPLFIEYKRLRVKISTLSAYQFTYKYRLAPKFGEMQISDITHKLVSSFALDLNVKGLKKRTITAAIILLNNMLDFASMEYEIPVQKTKIGKIDWIKDDQRGNKVEVYSNNELREIENYVKKFPNSFNVAILLLLYSGMRIGELCALRLRDIDVDNKVINVCATMQRVPFLATNEIQDLTDVEILRKANDSIVCVGPPKTSGSYREIPIYGFILDYYKHAKKMFCPDYFISTLSQNFIEPRNFRTRYRDVIISKVGLSRCLKLHACRHTFATNLITNGVDFRTTAELLGHSDVSTTLNIYSHATDDSKRKAISKVYNKIRRR